jgi:hypothetical protein
MNPEQTRLNIIYNSLQYQKTKEKRFKLAVLSDCKELLKYYHLSEKKTIKKDFNDSLLKFSGWVGGAKVINELINSL